jgi:predicted enzyme related to lactoylglutathione lyase
MTKFFRFDLRTTDADGARAFYTKILGHDRAVIWPLHEQALARGAKPHWLGQLGLEDVERAAAAFIARGGTPLGPTRPNAEGDGQMAVLRDPGGAIVAVATSPAPNAEARVDVVWHVLNTNDAARAKINYADMFGWELTDHVDAGAHGAFQQFAWKAGGESVGAIGDIAGRSGVHPHWLFYFEVDALDVAIAATRDAGGIVLDSMVLPSGARICVCDDPQGAAFGLRERRRLA